MFRFALQQIVFVKPAEHLGRIVNRQRVDGGNVYDVRRLSNQASQVHRWSEDELSSDGSR
jgi:hypothetical protein